jgi:hypothetical protein
MKLMKIDLKKLHLTSMETRKLPGGLIEVLKMFKGMDNLDVHKFFQLTNAPKTSQAWLSLIY